MDTRLFVEHQSAFSGQLLIAEALARHTYYRIGGPAQVLAIPKGTDDLIWLSQKIKAAGLAFGSDVFVLGLGSNLLVSDHGFSGVVIKTGRLNLDISREGDLLTTGSSVAVSTLLRRAAQEGLSGLEMLTGVPGSIGGVVAMNAGTHLGEAKDRLVSVEVFDLSNGSIARFSKDQLRFEYRKNLFLSSTQIVISAQWKIDLSEPALVKEKIDSTLVRRKSTQPLDYPSCGSVFKNPREAGLHAWQVIEKIGLRAHRIGNAAFSDKHSNFIVNLGGATAKEVRALIDLAKAKAHEELGIQLEEEVKYLGEF